MGFADATQQADLYFRTTEEMLEEFSYLGEEKAIEVVCTNTCKFADMCEDGIKPFVMMTGRVYPDVAGRFEDPVLWRDEVQYHLVVNDWLGRVAWYLTSPDGFNWTTQPGEAYMPGIARVAGGVTNEWFKYERMRVTTDVYGRVFQANFAVIDCVKREDRGGDSIRWPTSMSKP